MTEVRLTPRNPSSSFFDLDFRKESYFSCCPIRLVCLRHFLGWATLFRKSLSQGRKKSERTRTSRGELEQKWWGGISTLWLRLDVVILVGR